ncbi:MAG: MMPL family transporter [Bacteroidetes bacterium]|nr:MMPL family transporter [Bacteroidota bacterium]
MKKLVSYFIKYPVSANIILWLIVIFGFFSYFKLTSSFFPLVENRNINITLVYPGSSPEEIEEGVVVKIEEELKGVTGVERVTSVSQENAANIKVEIEKGHSTSKALEDVQNAVNGINSFPDGLEKPIVVLMENINFTISFSLSGKDVDLHTLKSFARQVEDDLLASDGISKVELNGFPDEEIQVAFREDAMRAYNLTFEQAAQAIRTTNIDITGGTIKTPAEELLIRGRNKGYHARELEDLVVKATPDGKVVRLGDVATITDRWAENPNKIVVNGERAVEIRVNSTDNENLLTNAAYVRDYINNFNEQNDVIKATLITDSSVNLNERRDLLVKNGLIGMLLVLVLLALFLNMRVAFWVALGIPISFFGMIILAMYYGVTVNVISLFGMIVVLGILVDDGIVIAENIYNHYERGKPAIRAAIDGTVEVIPAVFSAVVTTMVAFAFFFLVDGRAGEFFSELSFVVIATLGVSMIEALIILPSHMAHSKALRSDGADKNALERFTDRAMFLLRDRIYAPILRAALNNKFFTVALMVGLFMITIGAMKGGIVKTTFFPFIERDQVLISLTMPSGTRDYITEEKLVEIEEAVDRVNARYKKDREDSLDIVKIIVRKVGPQTHVGTVDVTLLQGEIRQIPSYEIENAIRQEVGSLAGAEKVTYGTASPFGKPVSVTLLSTDYKQLDKAKDEVKRAMQTMQNIKDVVENKQPGPQEIHLELKEKAHLLGLTEASILTQVRQGFFGYEVQRLQRGVDEVKVWVRYNDEDRSSIKNLEEMRIRTADGSAYPLRELATYKLERGVITINHLNAQREVTVEADLAGPWVSAPEEIATIRDSIMPNILKHYHNVTPVYEGQNREAAKTQKSSQTALPVILITILAIITFTFRSFGQTLVIFLLIPFSFIGVVWGHALHGNQLSILSFLGIVALIGIIVNDSLVLVTKMNASLKEGVPFKEAVYQAGYSRFRAIFLTSATTIAGLGPIIMEKSFQAQFLKPMAISVAYGIGVATVLTLILLPVLLMIWNSLQRRVHWLWNDRMPEPEEMEPAIIEMKAESEEYED